MRTIVRAKGRRVDEENPYWISFSDLMSALLVVFILAAVALIIELTQTQKKIEQDIEQLKHAVKARRDILEEVQAELKKRGIVVFIKENKSVLRIPYDTLSFDRGSYNLPENQHVRSNLLEIGRVLHAAMLRQFDSSYSEKLRLDYLDTVFIEGHTDSDPARHIPKGNWGLSTFRAISLWEFWRDNLSISPAFKEMVNSSGSKLFSVSGYAATRRVNTSESNEQERRQNRRIDIRFTVKRPEISKLEKIIQQ